MRKKLEIAANFATIVVAGCMLAVLSGYITIGPNRAAATGPKPVENWERYLSGGQIKGPASAPITLLEFGDYQCPFCATAAVRFDSVMEANPGKIRLVYRHWPLEAHRLAVPAARAAECAAQQNHFWDMHKMLYEKQDSLGLIPFSEFGARVGVTDSAMFSRCLREPTPMASIAGGAEDARAIGATGTPAVILNGKLLRSGTVMMEVVSALEKLRK